MMGTLLWRIAVVTALAVILGPALGLLSEALWTAKLEQAVIVLDGSVPTIAFVLSRWAAEATP